MSRMSPLHYQNPVHPHDFADPFVWHDGQRYYAIGTGRGDPASPALAAAGVFPLLQSDDLVHWRDAGRALPATDASLGDTFWAPEVAFAGGRWYLYYSVGFGDRRHQLRVAVADHPLGPYVDAAGLSDPAEVPFAIDPHPFQDRDGRWYLFHARDFLDTAPDGRLRVGTALVVQALQTMTELAPGPVHTVARASRDWQRFAANRPMYGGVHDWHTLEGPFVVYEGGRYWCLYSGGNWQNDTYGVDFVTSEHVLGPWHDTGGDHGPRVLRTVPGQVIGPGHCSVVTRIGAQAGDTAGRLIVYHAWGSDGQARRMCLDPLLVGPEGPRASGPTWTPQRIQE